MSLSMCSKMFTISPVNLTCTSLSISACINAPGMSRTATSRLSKASITAVRNTASVLTVGAVDSSLAMYALCFRLSAQPTTFYFPAAFSVEEHEVSQCLLPLFRCQTLLMHWHHHASVMQLAHLFFHRSHTINSEGS